MGHTPAKLRWPWVEIIVNKLGTLPAGQAKRTHTYIKFKPQAQATSSHSNELSV